ncbi:hypothetical protein [Dehalococcoides mccartyi]|uniref:hypothetical protein n=1 Tax=Dehalococcoides mccartyi TaxID=61435 RepID=UPI0003C8250C|nr:hypothetical protein [Dehalococcoides mccartyi]AHB14114.1 hypothetical protein GY50_1343 [Dehalococcoides mccartyi GY50]APH13021.1 hypothetical protein ASJ33_07565 [Dehalococcoides mccartyi]
MTETLHSLSPFEKAALIIQLRRLTGKDAIQVMQDAEYGWSNSTYYRRLDDALANLEKKGLVTRIIKENYQLHWIVSKNASKFLSSSELFEHCYYLGTRVDTLETSLCELQDNSRCSQKQLREETESNSTLRIELDELKNENQKSIQNILISRFPRLDLNAAWIEAILMLALVELMARHRLSTLGAEDAQNIPFSQLFIKLREVLPKTEGRSFQFDKDIMKILYGLRSKTIHNGLANNFRESETNTINELVLDIYKQLF